jgi:curved DNA-binding protein CbpA
VTTMPSDYYARLGLTREASFEEIKKSYRAKALELHPDRAGGSEEAFKGLTEAYAVLSDNALRARYDDALKRSPSGTTPDFDADDALKDLFTHPEFAQMFKNMANDMNSQGLKVDASLMKRIFGPETLIMGGVFLLGRGSLWGLAASVAQVAAKKVLKDKLEAKGGITPESIKGAKEGVNEWLQKAKNSKKSVETKESSGVAKETLKMSVDAQKLKDGGKIIIKIPSATGLATLAISLAAGTKSGTLLRLPKKGRSGNDLYLEILEKF